MALRYQAFVEFIFWNGRAASNSSSARCPPRFDSLAATNLITRRELLPSLRRRLSTSPVICRKTQGRRTRTRHSSSRHVRRAYRSLQLLMFRQGQAAWAQARSQMQARISSNTSAKSDVGNHFSIGDDDEDAFARELDQAMRQ